MKGKLRTRRSVQRLITLEGSGGLDSRSEVGTVIDIEEWSQKPEVKYHCHCEQVKDTTEELISSHIIITEQHMYLLRPADTKKTFVVRTRRTLNSIMKITTKARMSDVVKFQYGSKGCDGVVHVTDSDRFHVPNSSGLVKAIKDVICPKNSKSRRPSMVAELHQQRRKSKDSIDGSPTRSNIRRLSSSSQGRRTSVSSHDRRMSVSSQERILASKSQEQLASEDSYEGQASPCLSTQEREMSTVSDDCSFLQDTRRPSTASTSSEGLSVRVPVIRRSSLRTPQELRLQNNSGFPIELGIPLQDMRRRPSLPALGMHSAEDTLIQNHDDKRRASKPASLLKFLKKKLAN